MCTAHTHATSWPPDMANCSAFDNTYAEFLFSEPTLQTCASESCCAFHGLTFELQTADEQASVTQHLEQYTFAVPNYLHLTSPISLTQREPSYPASQDSRFKGPAGMILDQKDQVPESTASQSQSHFEEV